MITYNDMAYNLGGECLWQQRIDHKMKISLAAAYFTLSAYPHMGAKLEKMEYGKELSIFQEELFEKLNKSIANPLISNYEDITHEWISWLSNKGIFGHNDISEINNKFCELNDQSYPHASGYLTNINNLWANQDSAMVEEWVSQQLGLLANEYGDAYIDYGKVYGSFKEFLEECYPVNQ